MTDTRPPASTSDELSRLFAALWDDYIAIAPQAARVVQLLTERGETIVNDHIALRTFGVPAIDIDVLARPFCDLGYRPAADYDFPVKKLSARHFEHPDRGRPKVFISQLRVGELSSEARDIIADLVAAMPTGITDRPDFPASGRPWPVSHARYRRLRKESEYAAWMSAFGFRANHFTIDVGALATFAGLAELNDFLQARGFELNDSGGLIKGSPGVFLEQSSTRASAVDVEFSDGVHSVPSCYYEFARRHPLPSGEIFSGFVTGSADRLFESTDARR